MKLTNTILNSLFKAADTHKKMKFKAFTFTHMELELSILPMVSLKFSPHIPQERDESPPSTLITDEAQA